MKEKTRAAKYAIRILVILAVSAVIIVFAARLRPDPSEQTSFTIRYDLLLWYYDDTLTPYLESFRDDYFKQEGKRVDIRQVGSLEFFDSINRKNVEAEDAPDLYIIDSSKLERAWLSSLAKTNENPLYTETSFHKKALEAASCRGHLAGYPLCFNTSFLAFHADETGKAPQTFAEMDKAPGMDVSSLLYTYCFIGDQISLGGPAGDDASAFDLSSDGYTESLAFLQDFAASSGLSSALSDYSSVEKDFIAGKTEAAVFSLPSLTRLYSSVSDLSIAEIPDLTDSLKAKPLSQTSVICVNPDSDHVKDAERLAQFLSFDYAGHLFDTCGLFSAALPEEEAADFTLIRKAYEESASLPKLIETEDIWENLNQLLQSVWDGEDIEKAQSKLNVAIYVALSTRTEQEDR